MFPSMYIAGLRSGSECRARASDNHGEHLGVNVIKYLRKHLEAALVAPGNQGLPSWDGTEGRVAVEPWTDHPPERVWVFDLPPRRPLKVIGRLAKPGLRVE